MKEVAAFREEHFLSFGFSQCWSAPDFDVTGCDGGGRDDVMGFHRRTINSIVLWYHDFLNSFELQCLGLGGEVRGEQRGTSVGCSVRVEEEELMSNSEREKGSGKTGYSVCLMRELLELCAGSFLWGSLFIN